MVALFWQLRATGIHPIVLGGLVPEILAGTDREGVPDHMGTNDVDLLVAFHVSGEGGNDEPDLGALETALRSAGLVVDPEIEGWRWIATVDGRRVKVDFLCDRDDVENARVITPRGCKDLRFANLRGSGYVSRDFAEEAVTDLLADGTKVTVTIRFAALQGYVLAKLAALLDRQRDKDHYDLVYVLLHHKAGTGPRGVAQALLNGPFAKELPSLQFRVRELAARFLRSQDNGPVAYAKQFTLVYPEVNSATLKQDAISAIEEFTRPLMQQGTPR
jgi:hypothetical protein